MPPFKKISIDSLERSEMAWLTILLLVAVGGLDRVTGSDVSVAFFYLLPISVAVWRLGKWEGTSAAVAAALIWYAAMAGYWHGAHQFWNTLMRLGIFVLYANILSLLKTMVEHLKEERSRSRQLAVMVLNAQEEERRRIARELHDEASQALATLTLRIEEIRRRHRSTSSESDEREMLDLKTLTEQVLSEIRKLAFTLRPTLLDDLGLRQALQALFREQLKKRGIEVEVRFEGDVRRLPLEIELTLFRAAQEAASNILRHAQAGRVKLRLKSEPDQVVMEIEDNGVGFIPEKYRPSDHLGIFGMRERALLLSGRFKLQSSPGKGTAISISIPVRGRAPKNGNSRMAKVKATA